MLRRDLRPARRLLVILLLVIGMALLVHLTGMGVHEMSMFGTCLAVLHTIVVSFFLALVVRGPVGSPVALSASVAAPAAPPATGRYPPDDGTVLRQ